MVDFSTQVEDALTSLKQECVLLYPSDTIWGIGCDARSTKAVEAIYRLKQRKDTKALICLVSNREMLEAYVGKIPEVLQPFLTESRPTTVIYPAINGVCDRICAEDGSIGIRIAQDDFCQELIQALGAPLVSTSANVSGEASPSNYQEISPQILSGVDHIVPLRQNKTRTQASRIIRLQNDNSIAILRP